MSYKAPVLLFTYRKPQFLEEIFRAIEQYAPPRLYVVSNQYANKDEVAAVSSIRNTISQWKLSGEIIRIFRDKHLLINDSIRSGLDHVLEIEDAAIVLEDDTVPSPSFFAFCNEILERYRDSDDIGSVIGCNLSAGNDENAHRVPFAFVYWGWATWARKWRALRNTPLPWGARDNKVADKLQDPASIIVPFLERIDDRCTWDVLWGWQQALHDMEVVIPGHNLICNKGFVEEGSYIRFMESRFSSMPANEFRTDNFDVIKCRNQSYRYEKASADLLQEILSFRKETAFYADE